jgi:DnaJ-class molecular chaperone
LQLYEQESNFYEIIGVHRDSPLNEIKKAYRTRSIDLHPDKNPAPQAAEEFNRLRTAFEVF